MSSFYLKILASNKVFFSGKADILVVPGLDGEIAIMAHHQNMAIATTIGDVRFKPEGSDEYIDAVVGIGFGDGKEFRRTLFLCGTECFFRTHVNA